MINTKEEKRGVEMIEKVEEKSKIIKTSKEYKRTIIEEKIKNGPN